MYWIVSILDTYLELFYFIANLDIGRAILSVN